MVPAGMLGSYTSFSLLRQSCSRLTRPTGPPKFGFGPSMVIDGGMLGCLIGIAARWDRSSGSGYWYRLSDGLDDGYWKRGNEK